MKQHTTTAASKLFVRLFTVAFALFALIMTSMPAEAQSPNCYPTFNGPMGVREFRIYVGTSSAGTKIFDWSGCTCYNGSSFISGMFVSNTCSLTKGTTYYFEFVGGDYYAYNYRYGYSYWYGQNVSLFLDANGNNDFNDASGVAITNSSQITAGGSECMWYNSTAASYSNYTWTGTFTIPNTGSSGSRRFRVESEYYGYYYGIATPCNSRGDYYGSYLDFNVNAQYVTQNDAGIAAIVSPTANFNSLVPQVIQVSLKNFSKNRLTSCTVNWSVDGVTKTPYNWTGALDSGQTATVILSASYTYTAAAPWNPMALSVWTTKPQGTNIEANSYPDAQPNNDRVNASIPPLLNDAGFIDADAMIPIAFGPNSVLLKIKNFAPKPLTSCTINWQVDGVAQTPFYWTGNIAKDQTLIVNVGTYYFGGGTQAYEIKAWTSVPNGVPDENTSNDGNTVQVYKALLGGTYTIGPRESDYVSIIEAVDFINYWGLAGPVTFLVRPGTYQGAVTFTPKNRQFPISFESITRRNLDVIVQNTATTNANDFVFKLDGYDGITFRNLTMTANGTFGKVIQMSNGTDNVTIDGCQLNGVANAGSITTNAILYSDGVLNTFKATKNSFSKGSYAAYFASINSSGVTFSNNDVAGVTKGGFYINGPTGQWIEGNTFFGNGYTNGIYSVGSGTILTNRINNVTDAGGVTTPLTSAAGIYVTGTTFNVHDNTVGGTNTNGITANAASDVTLVSNNVNITTNLAYERGGIVVINVSTNSDVRSNIVQTTNAHGIYYSGSTNAEVSYNNIIVSNGTTTRGALTFGTSGGYIADNMMSATNENGLVLTNPTTVEAYYNTVLCNTATGRPAVVTNASGNVTLERNIFQNNAGGIALQVTGTIQTSNFNNIFSKGGTYTVLNNGVNLAGISNWTAATGKDANSVSLEAKFMSTTDLRLTTVNPSLYYTYPLFTDSRYDMFEAKDYTNTARTKTYYMGAQSIIPTITIASQPEDIIDCIGTTNHTLVVVANADYNALLSYQWYKDGVALNGQTNPIYYINNALTHDMNAIYMCKITSNGEASDISTSPALLYTLRPTKITRQPLDRRIDLGALSTFEVDMNVFQDDPVGYQPSIQWYRGGVMLQDNDRIAGTKSSILTIRDIQPIDYGNDYYVKIVGKCGTDSSNMIVMSEIPKLTLTDLAATNDVCTGSPLSITLTAVTSIPNVKIAYQWMLNGAPIAGATTATYTVLAAAAKDAGDYTCVVTLENNYDMKTSTVCKVTVNDAPMIVTDLQTTESVQTGKDLTLAIVAKGNNMTYQWYKNSAALTGETNAIYSKTGVDATDEGTYTVKITNPCGEVTSAECVVSITPFMILDVTGQTGDFILNQNTPNPFSTTTTISFVLPEASNVRLAITDLYGRELSVVANQTMSAGVNRLDVRALDNNLTAGVYFYTLTVNGKSETKTMVVVK